jgi:HK97 family phage prohead protease
MSGVHFLSKGELSLMFITKRLQGEIALNVDSPESSIDAGIPFVLSSEALDRSNEKILISSWDFTEFEQNPIALFDHDPSMPIGVWKDLRIEDNKLLATLIPAQAGTSDEIDEIRSLLEQGILRACSVGFSVLSSHEDEVSEITIYDSVKLVEASIVSIGSNPEALALIKSKSHSFNIIKEKSMSASIIKSDKSRQYSLSKFLLGLADPQARSDAGFEFEISQELARKAGKSSSVAMIPFSALRTKGVADPAPQDTITAPDQHGQDLGQSLATPSMDASLYTLVTSAEYKQAVAGRIGVSTVQAPRTNVLKVPRLVKPLSPTWVARDADLVNGDAYFDSVDAKPHTLGIVTQINRSALIDTNPEMESIIANEIIKSITAGLDSAIIGAESPEANAPEGIYNRLKDMASDFGTVETAQDVLNVIKLAQVANDSDVVKMLTGYGFNVWASEQAMSETLTQTPFMIENGQLRGGFTDIVTSAKMDYITTDDTVPFIVGDFSYLNMILFGQGLEVMVNPYAEGVYQKGAILMRGILDCDMIIRDEMRFFMGRVAVPSQVSKYKSSKSK